MTSILLSESPRRRSIDNSASLTDASSSCLATDKLLLSRTCTSSNSVRLAAPLPSSTPTRAHTARRRDILAHTDYTCATDQTSHFSPCRPNCSPPPPRAKFRLLRQTRHMREARRSAAGAHTHETLLRFPMQGLCRCSTSAPSVVRAFLDRDRDSLPAFLIGMKLFRATSLLIFLQSLSWPPLPSVVSGTRRRSSACCSGRISFPRINQARQHRGAVREEHSITRACAHVFGALGL